MYCTSLRDEVAAYPRLFRRPVSRAPKAVFKCDLLTYKSETSLNPIYYNSYRFTLLLHFNAMEITASPAHPRIAFISGHTDLTINQFNLEYIPLLHAAIQSGQQFIIGDAAGTDTFALSYLLS